MRARSLCLALALLLAGVTGGPPVAASETGTVTVERSGKGTGTVLATGISCGQDCAESYPTGTLVRLMAYPARGSTITWWAGCDYTITNECVVTASSDRTVEVRFAPTPSDAATEITSSAIRSAKRRATFEFTGSSPLGEVTFECRMDGRFRACTSPRTYRQLPPGSHTFQVRAVDRRGVDPTPAETTFVIRKR